MDKWEKMLRRALVLCDFGYGLDNVKISREGKHFSYSSGVLEAEPFTAEWVEEWYGEKPKGYVVAELERIEANAATD